MILIKKDYEHYVNIDTEVNLSNHVIHYNIHIVYFINCLCNINYLDWLVNQINLVRYMNANIHIISVIPSSKENEFRQKVLQLFPNVIIECYYENEFEYRGILKVWQLGQTFYKTNDIILYFHSKGMTHAKSYEHNKNDNYNIILNDIHKIKEIFTVFPKIDKIGFFSGGCGWIWYNFWYVRGSYIHSVEKPLKTSRRHYYEDWLGRKVSIADIFCDHERCTNTYYENTLHNCYSFFTDKITIANIGSYYDPNTNQLYNYPNTSSGVTYQVPVPALAPAPTPLHALTLTPLHALTLTPLHAPRRRFRRYLPLNRRRYRFFKRFKQ